MKLFHRNSHPIVSAAAMEDTILSYGMLLFFKSYCGEPCIHSLTPSSLWFDKDSDGPWDWKGPVIRGGRVAYSKFFSKKAGFVALEHLADVLNVLRTKYKPAGAMISEAAMLDEVLYGIISERGRVRSDRLKELCGVTKKKRRTAGDPVDRLELEPIEASSASLDGALTRLQSRGLIVIADFEYPTTRKGNPYGWGLAVYATPEHLYGIHACRTDRSTEESLTRLKKISAIAELL